MTQRVPLADVANLNLLNALARRGLATRCGDEEDQPLTPPPRPPVQATPPPPPQPPRRVYTPAQAARRNDTQRARRARAAALRVESKELDLLVAAHDASGSSAIADAMRFAHGRNDDRTRADVERAIDMMARVDDLSLAKCANDYLERSDAEMQVLRLEDDGSYVTERVPRVVALRG